MSRQVLVDMHNKVHDAIDESFKGKESDRKLLHTIATSAYLYMEATLRIADALEAQNKLTTQMLEVHRVGQDA